MRTKRLMITLLIAAGAALSPAVSQARDVHSGAGFGYSAHMVPVQSRGHYVWDGYRYVWVNERAAPNRYYSPYSEYRGDGYRARRYWDGRNWRDPRFGHDEVANPGDDRGGHKADRD